MTCNVLMGTLNPTHSLTHSVTHSLNKLEVLAITKKSYVRNSAFMSQKFWPEKAA